MKMLILTATILMATLNASAGTKAKPISYRKAYATVTLSYDEKQADGTGTEKYKVLCEGEIQVPVYELSQLTDDTNLQLKAVKKCDITVDGTEGTIHLMPNIVNVTSLRSTDSDFKKYIANKPTWFKNNIVGQDSNNYSSNSIVLPRGVSVEKLESSDLSYSKLYEKLESTSAYVNMTVSGKLEGLMSMSSEVRRSDRYCETHHQEAFCSMNYELMINVTFMGDK